MYFAAEPTGQFSSSQLDKITRFSLAMVEFRHGQHAVDGWADFKGENYSQIACAAIKAHGANPPPCLVYRSGKWAGYFMKLQKAFLSTQSRFLSPDKDGECAEDMGFARGQDGNLNMTQTVCKYDFRQVGVRDWYADTMLAEIASEPSVDGVFIDNAQSVGCDNIAHYTDMNATERAAFMELQLHSYTAGFQAIANADKYSVFSTTNQFAQPKGKILNFETGCGDSEEDIMTAFNGIPWARNYEFWMWQTGDICSSQMLNAINETQRGVPIFAHVPYFPVGSTSEQGGCQEKCYLPSNNGQDYVAFNEDQFLNFTMAAFLVAMGNGSYFGFSNMDHPGDSYQGGGWFDVSWQYYDNYDWVIGEPLGGPEISNNLYTFRRSFENVDVMINCYTGEYSIEFDSNTTVTLSATLNAPCSQLSSAVSTFKSSLSTALGVASDKVSASGVCGTVVVSATVVLRNRTQATEFTTQFTSNATSVLEGTPVVTAYGRIASSSASIVGESSDSGGSDSGGDESTTIIIVVVVVVVVAAGAVAGFLLAKRSKRASAVAPAKGVELKQLAAAEAGQSSVGELGASGSKKQEIE